MMMMMMMMMMKLYYHSYSAQQTPEENIAAQSEGSRALCIRVKATNHAQNCNPKKAAHHSRSRESANTSCPGRARLPQKSHN